MVEFHPQCDTKQATTGCESTRCCSDQTLALDAALERVEPTFGGSGGEVWPDNPHERSAGEREPVSKLLELRRVQEAGAPEGHVDDGAVGPRVQPFEAPRVLRQEVAHGLLELPVGEERADGQDVGEELERAGLGVVDGGE